MNQVYVCGTYFHVYVSILKVIHNHKDSQRLLILNTLTPGIDRIIPGLLESGFFNFSIQVPFKEISLKMKREQGFWSKFFSRKKGIVRYVDANSDLLKYHDFIRHSEINLFHHVGMSASYFITKYSNTIIRMLEDGNRNYIGTISPFKFFKRKYILNVFIGEGQDKEIKEIHVQFPDKLNAQVRHKGVKLDLKEMQRKLTAQDNEKILNVFMGEHMLNLCGNKKLILITQPLSEDKFITEEYKISLYTHILEAYSADYDLFIKPHPRETTNYKKHFSFSIFEIPRTFPLEMFDLMKNIKFEVGVTVSSGGIMNVDCISDKIILGEACVKNMLPGKAII